ncbi:Lysylphosphatidylglycerol synthase TM region [uncultured archaeon]|nr:Lysylphosphatidylglycerol synthase TM region [uncultured archaeon]
MRRSPLLIRVLAFSASLAILLALIHFAGFENFYQIMLNASPLWLAAAVAIYAASWIFRTFRLGTLSKEAGANIGVWELFKLQISGYALNVILPAKLGDAATVCYLTMRGIGIGMSTAIVVQCRVLDVLALILLSLSSLALLFRKSPPEWIWMTIIGSLLIVSLCLGVVLLDRKMSLLHLSGRYLEPHMENGYLRSFSEKARDAYVGYRDIASNKLLFATGISLSLFIWLLDCLACYMVSLAVGAQVSLLAVILAVSLGNMGKSAPATPGSIGIYESILAAALAFFGMPIDLAVSIAILDHALKNIFTLALGIPATTEQSLDLYELVRRGEVKEC